MKIKVKGLVFVGFAAAVFAQSALAADGDNKIVTSKQYVDNTFQTLANITTTSEITDNGSNTEAVAAHWNSEAEYPSMAVLKSVKDTVTGMTFSGDQKYIDVATSNGATSVTLDTNNLASDAAAITSTASGDSTTPAAQDKLVKVSAVNAYAEAKANKLDGDTTNNNTIASHSNDSTAYPSAKAVYDFVTGVVGDYQRELTSEETGLYVGTYDTQNSGTWKQIQGGDYVTITETSTGSGVYTVDVPSAKIATANGDITGNIDATAQAKLVTAGAVKSLLDTSAISDSSVATVVPSSQAVYNFVNGNYQPKTTGTTVKVGYDGNWRELTVDSTYMTLNTTTGAAVGLTNLTSATTDVSSSAGTKLVTSGVLYDMLGGLSIPAPIGECANTALNSDSAGACALVMAWDGTANAVTLKWRKMAQ